MPPAGGVHDRESGVFGPQDPAPVYPERHPYPGGTCAELADRPAGHLEARRSEPGIEIDLQIDRRTQETPCCKLRRDPQAGFLEKDVVHAARRGLHIRSDLRGARRSEEAAKPATGREPERRDGAQIRRDRDLAQRSPRSRELRRTLHLPVPEKGKADPDPAGLPRRGDSDLRAHAPGGDASQQENRCESERATRRNKARTRKGAGAARAPGPHCSSCTRSRPPPSRR